MFTEQISRAGQIAAPVVNKVEKTDLVRKARTMWLEFRLRLTLTLAGGPATAILNGGSPWAMFDRVGLDENGAKNIDADPRLIAALSEMLAPRTLDHGRVRQTLLADGPYNLEESIFLPFSSIQVAGPTETAFMERNPAQQFSAFVQLGSLSGIDRLVKTPGTAVVSGVSVEVIQRYDLERDKRVILLPVIRQIEQNIVGASSDFPFKIESTAYLAGMIFQQSTTGAGEVTDVIDALALRADGRDFIGPDKVGYEELQAMAQMEFSGDCVARGYLPVWFRKGGRLSNVVNANSLANFRAVLDCQPSVVAGAGTSFVRALLLELVAVPGLTVQPKDFRI